MRLSLEKEYCSLLAEKRSLEKELAALPSGYLSVKTIKGKAHHYLQRRDGARITGIYIPAGDVQRVSADIEQRKTVVSEIPRVNARLTQLEQAAKLIGNDLFCRLMICKMSAGMDELNETEKAKCASFGSAMNAIEGVLPSAQAELEINEWKAGKRTFISVFESVLKRYGFPTEVQI